MVNYVHYRGGDSSLDLFVANSGGCLIFLGDALGELRGPVDEAAIWKSSGLPEMCPVSDNHALATVGFRFDEGDGHANRYEGSVATDCKSPQIWVEYVDFRSPSKAKSWLRKWSPEVNPGSASWRIKEPYIVRGPVIQLRHGIAVGCDCSGVSCATWEYVRQNGRSVWMMSVRTQ